MTETVNIHTGEIFETYDADGRLVNSLEELEETIEQGLKTFVEVGNALATIRDLRMYREQHSTFEEYCQGRWNMSRPRAYQLIEAAEVVGALSTNVDTPLPSSEGQARELSGLPVEHAAETMRTAHESTAGKVTAKAIREARAVTAADLSLRYVEQFPALKFFADRGEHQRVNALGRDLAAMDVDELTMRLGVLDKTIAHEKRVAAGQSRPRHLSAVSTPGPATEPEPAPVASNPDADDLVQYVERVAALMRVVDVAEINPVHKQLIADASQMLASFANRMKES